MKYLLLVPAFLFAFSTYSASFLPDFSNGEWSRTYMELIDGSVIETQIEYDNHNYLGLGGDDNSGKNLVHLGDNKYILKKAVSSGNESTDGHGTLRGNKLLIKIDSSDYKGTREIIKVGNNQFVITINHINPVGEVYGKEIFMIKKSN